MAKSIKDLLANLKKVASNIGNVNQQYQQRVSQAQQTPFFNQNNTVPQWLGKVVQDVQQRGMGEGFHDLTYPITTNPYIRPISDLGVSWARMTNLNAGRPSSIVNLILGQQDKQMAPDFQNHNKRNLPTFYKDNIFGGNQ